MGLVAVSIWLPSPHQLGDTLAFIIPPPMYLMMMMMIMAGHPVSHLSFATKNSSIIW
jgi:hypothetical protein